MAAETEGEVAPLLLIPAAKAATAGQYGAAGVGINAAEVPTTATTTTRASSAFGFDSRDDNDDDDRPKTPSLLVSSVLLASDDAAAPDGGAADCRARRRLGPWAALLLAIAGAAVGGVGPRLGWTHAALLPVLVPCAVLAFWPLLPALRRAVRLRRATPAALVALGVGAALLLGHPGVALTMLAMALLAERVAGAADVCVTRSLGGLEGGGRGAGLRLPKIVRRRLRADGGDDDEEEEIEELVPTSTLVDGDVVVVRAGETVPVEGAVVGGGQGAVEEAGLTGEAMPAEKREGRVVLAGSVLRSGGPLHIRYNPNAPSLYHAMEAATAEEGVGVGVGVGVVDRFSGWYAPLALGAALVLAVVPEAEYALRHGKPFALRAALSHTLELLALASPMALAMAAPLPYLTALAGSVARGGVVIKSPLALERLGRVQVVALDKTGTLTEGRFQVSGRHQLTSSILPPALVRRLAAAVERGVAHHRLAAAVVKDAVVDNGEGEEEGDVTVARLLELDGMGVEALCTVRPRGDTGKPTPYKVVVGSAFLLEDEEREEPGLRAFLEGHPGEAHLFVVVNGNPELALALTDPIRPDAARAIAGLHALGIETAVLTGDRADAAVAIQAQTGAQAARGRMSHEAKREWVRARQIEPPPASLALGPKPLAAGDSAGARLLSALPAVITEEAGDATIATTTIGGGGSSSSSSSWQPADAPPAVGGDEEQGGSGPQPLSSPAPRCRRTHVGMVGDGASDAAALAAADVGIAVRGGPGGGGSALAAGAAGVVVLLDGQGRGGRGSLRRIPQAIDLAAAVRAVVLENVALAVAVKFALLLVLLVGCAAWGQQRGAGAGGRSRLWMGVASDGVALAAVVANGLRPLWLARRVYK